MTKPGPDSAESVDPAMLRSEIDAVLFDFMAGVRGEFEVHGAGQIIDELRSTLRAGGKRLRPLLCCYGFKAVGGTGTEEILRAAASLELLHTFAIIHDDVMDQATRRRGAPAALQRVTASLGEAEGFASRKALSVTILIGDLAFALSDRMFVNSGFKADDLQRAWPALNQMRMHACAGQFLDLVHSGNESTDSETALKIARLKSGSYSVSGPLLVGAALAGATSSSAASLTAFGEPLGLAFQLSDDAMDFLGNPADTGKDATDLDGAKMTYLLAKAIELGSTDQVDALKKGWAQKESRRLAAGDLIHATGALEVTTRLIRDLVNQSLEAIADPQTSGLDPAASNDLASIARKIGGLDSVVGNN